MARCNGCEYYNECEYADNYNFCDDCKDSFNCPIRYDGSCKAGYDIECNNGFEEREWGV